MDEKEYAREEYLRRSMGIKGYGDGEKSQAGLFAIAFAVLVLSDKTDDVGRALRLLGTADAATPMGALEVVSVSLERIADSISGLSGEL